MPRLLPVHFLKLSVTGTLWQVAQGVSIASVLEFQQTGMITCRGSYPLFSVLWRGFASMGPAPPLALCQVLRGRVSGPKASWLCRDFPGCSHRSDTFRTKARLLGVNTGFEVFLHTIESYLRSLTSDTEKRERHFCLI